MILQRVSHELDEKTERGLVAAALDTDENVRLIDCCLASMVPLASDKQSVLDLLYRLNLQRRGVMRKGLKQCARPVLQTHPDSFISLPPAQRPKSADSVVTSTPIQTSESGFDTNWTYLQSQIFFEQDK